MALQETLDKYKLTKHQLEVTFSADAINSFSLKLDGLESLAPFIGLSEEDYIALKDIEGSYDAHRLQFFTRWRNKLGNAATYLMLAEGLEKAGYLNLVGDLCELYISEDAKVLARKAQGNLEEKVMSFTAQFQELVKVILEEVKEGNKVTVDDLLIDITLLPDPIRLDHLSFLEDNMENIMRASNLHEIILYFNLYWDCLNFNLLEVIIGKHGSDSIKEKMKSYVSDMEQFRQNTKVANFIPYCPKNHKFKTVPKELIQLGIHSDLSKYTLMEVEEMKCYICGLCKLPNFALIFYDLSDDCLEITWLVPIESVESMKAILKSEPIEEALHITSILVGKECVYKKENVEDKKKISGHGLLEGFQHSIQRLMDALYKFNGLNSQSIEVSTIYSIIKELETLFLNGSEEANIKCVNYIGSRREILDLWYKFQSWQFISISSSYENKSELINCLFLMSSLVLSWTDKSHVFRHGIVNHGYLLYHVMQLKGLEAIRSKQVAKDLSTFNIAIITNCGQDLSFHQYIFTIQWKNVLRPWITSSSKELQFHSKLLGCLVASSFDCNDLHLIDMDSADIETLLKMLGSASTSAEMKASGFSFNFSAAEILQSLLHLFISKKNIASASKVDVMPTIVALFVNGRTTEILLTCQLLWVLLGESCFQWDEELYCNPVKRMLLTMLRDDDQCVQVHSKLLLAEPCFIPEDFEDELQGIQNIFQLSPNHWCHIGQSVGLNKNYRSAILALSTLTTSKRVLFTFLLEYLEKTKSTENFFDVMLSCSTESYNFESDLKYSSEAGHLQDQWMKNTLSLYERLANQFLTASNAEKDDFLSFVVPSLRQISEAWKVYVPKVMKVVVDECVAMDSIWHVYFELLSLIYRAELLGYGTRGIQICLVRLITILRDWSAISQQFCSSLLNKGLIMNICSQLLNWTSKSHTKLVEYMVKANLRILLSCLHCSEFKVYVKAFDWMTLLAQLKGVSSISGIQLATKVLGNYLFSYNPAFPVGLAENDVYEMLDMSHKAAGSYYELDEFSFYSLDSLKCLRKYIENSKDKVLPAFCQASLLPVVINVMYSGTLEEKIEICLLAWDALSASKYNLTEYSDLLRTLKGFKESSEELESILKCVLASCEYSHSAGVSNEDESPTLELLMKTCYKYSRYEDCVLWCLKKEDISLSEVEILQTKIIRAKALYHLYRNEQNRLQFNPRTKDVYYRSSQRCYDKTKEVIHLLGMAYDNDSLDSEGSKMFFFSMMDYIHATNKLNDCKRCYLCWKNLHIRSSSTDKPSKENSKHLKLVHSHPIPHSLLYRLAQSVPTGKNMKILRSTAEGTLLESQRDKVYAPKQITRFMFCTTCEDILSAKGETQFIRDFFSKIYDPANPSKPHQSQNIEYGKWLYHFCAGIIYRNLIWKENSFLNEDELYELLLGCRDYILSSELSSNSPQLYIFMTPISGDEDDLRYGAINNVLSGSLEWYIGRHKLKNNSLETEDALFASFFLFHLGVINILVKFKPSHDYNINAFFKINSGDSLTYPVPEESERKKILPPGMWTHLLCEAMNAEQKSLENPASSFSVDLDALDDTFTLKSGKMIEVFGVVDGVRKQMSEASLRGIQPSSSTSEKRFNFLPAGLEVRSEARPNSVLLPQGHSILLHHTFSHSPGTGETIFIIRDSVKDGCYLIWNNFIPGLQYTIAFNISVSELLLTNVIVDEQPPRALKSLHLQEILENARRKISSVLSGVLLKKGIFCLQSLLSRAKEIQAFPSVDMKCEKETECWFCSSRCDVCLEILGLDSIKAKVNNTDVRVCREGCSQYVHGKMQTSIIVANPGEMPPPFYLNRSGPLFKSHKKYFHVYIKDTSEDMPLMGDIAVCYGDGSPGYPENKMYGVYFSRTLQKQMLIEFFLSDSFNILKPLPFDQSNELLVSVLEACEQSGLIRRYLCLAYDEFKKPVSLDNQAMSKTT